MTWPLSSFFKYRFASTRNAFSDSFGSGSRATTSMALESAILISSMGRPSPRGTECDVRQAGRPSLGGGAAKEGTGDIPFFNTYVTSNPQRCYHVCYHTDLRHKKMAETCLKLLPSIEAVTGRGVARHGPDAWCRECRHRGKSPPLRGLGPPTRTQSPRAGSATSCRS